MSLRWPPARRGHATHSDPAGKMRWASAGSRSGSSASSRKKAITMSAGAGGATATTPSGSSGTRHPVGARSSESRLPGLMPSFFASGVCE